MMTFRTEKVNPWLDAIVDKKGFIYSWHVLGEDFREDPNLSVRIYIKSFYPTVDYKEVKLPYCWDTFKDHLLNHEVYVEPYLTDRDHMSPVY